MKFCPNLQLDLLSTRNLIDKIESFSDRLLRFWFSELLVNSFWRFYYSRSSKAIGIIIGAVILTISMQTQASAQLFDNVETSELEGLLPEVGSGIDFIKEIAQLLFLGGGVVGIGGGAYQFMNGRSAEVWMGIGGACVISLALISWWSTAIYGS